MTNAGELDAEMLRNAREGLDDDEKGVDSIHTPGGPQRIAEQWAQLLARQRDNS